MLKNMYIFSVDFFFIEINVLSFLKWTVDAWYNWGHRKRLNQVTISRRNGYFHFHVHCRIIHNNKDMEQCKSPSMGELKKGWHFIYLLHMYYAYTHTHVCVCTGISFSHKRRNPAICDNMDNLGLLDTHRLVGVSLLWGHCSFLLGPGAHKVLFVPSKSLFPSPG